MHRYSTDSKDCKVIPLAPRSSQSSQTALTSSIAEWVLRRKEFCSLSYPEQNKHFRGDIDQPPAITGEIKRLLSVPICDLNFGTVVGAIHMVNKVQKDRFSMAEEQYAIAYGELVGGLVSSSVKYRRLEQQSQKLCSLIQAPLQLLDSIQAMDQVCLADALYALEETLRDTLHCAHAKAYLIAPSTTDSAEEQKTTVGGGEEEEGVFLTTLDGPPLGLKDGKRQGGTSLSTKRCLISPTDSNFQTSIAAYTINTQRTFLAGAVVPPGHHDFAALCPEGADYNPDVDMSPPPPLSKKNKSSSSLDPYPPPTNKEITSPVFYCVPIMNLQKEVIGCLQASPSPRSPPLQSSLDPGSSGDAIHTITFQDAMGWMGYLLSSKVRLMELGQLILTVVTEEVEVK